jgi:hypothetical protein
MWRTTLAINAFLATAATGGLHSQALDISGYYENTLQVDYTADTKEQLLNASKLRLDFSSSVPGGFEFVGNVNLIVNVGALERDIRAYIPDSAARELEASGAPTSFSLERTRIFLDNAYLSWTTRQARVRLGLQQLSWGPGYSYNPTDLFHRKLLLDPAYEKEGVAALRFDYRWGVGGEASFITAPSEDFESSGYALRVATHLSSIGYDVAITGHYVSDSTSIDRTTMAPLEQDRWAAGLELSGELLGLGAWLEGNYNWMESESDFARFVLGIDYTLDDGTYLMAEWLYDGRSETGPPYPIEDWLANLYFGEPVGPGWILTGATTDLSDLALGSLYLFSATDGSFMLNPRLDVSVAQNADLVAFGGFTFGREDGVFPSGLLSLLARLTVYF